MFWTEEHDVIIVREMLANCPLVNTKRGSTQRGRIWNEIAEHFLNVETPRFKVDQRGVGERDSLVAKTYRKKILVKDDKKDAEDIRKRAMERLGEKRSENEGKVKKRRSSGN